MRAILVASCLLACTAALAQQRPAGVVDFVQGPAAIESRGGASRPARAGEAIAVGDSLATAAGAELHLRMADGAFLSLRENSRITVAEYVAEGGDQDRSLIELAKGAFRILTGWIGKYNAEGYQVRTLMVNIGVRGTDHEPTYLPPGDPRGPAGSYDKVYEGRTFMRTPAGTIEVPASSVAYAAAPDVVPRFLDAVPPALFRPSPQEARFLERARASVRTLDQQRGERRKSPGKDASKSSDSQSGDRGSVERAERGERAEKPERAEKVERPERVDRAPDRPGRPAR